MIIKPRGMKLKKRGIVCVLIALFFLVLISFGLAQTSQTGCFNEPSYVGTQGACKDMTLTAARAACSGDTSCIQKYFYAGQSCSSVLVCQKAKGWCTDACNKQVVDYPAECPDRTKFVSGTIKPLACVRGCCVCAPLSGQGSNICQDSSGNLWSSETQASCSQKCTNLNNYVVGAFNTTTDQTGCSALCNAQIPLTASLVGAVTQSGGVAHGSLITNAQISVAGQKTMSIGLPPGTLPSTPNYQLSNLPAGQFTVSVSKPTYAPNTFPVTLLPGQQSTLALTLSPVSTGNIFGRVSDGNGLPLNNVLVYAAGNTYSQDYTDANGDYNLPSLPGQQAVYKVAATKFGYVTASTQVTLTGSQSNNFTLILQPQGFIYGWVKDITSNALLSQAQVWVDNKLETLTDNAGFFNVSVFANDTGVSHTIYITKGGYKLSSSQTILVKRTENKPTQDFLLESTTSACSYPANVSVPNFKADHILGSKGVRLSWTSPCSQVAGFYINRTTGSGILTTEISLTYLSVVDPNQMPLSFVDSNVNWGSTYNYKIWAVYNDQVLRLAPETMATIITGDAICEGKYKVNAFTEFCVNGTLRKTCGNTNQMISASPIAGSPVDCSTKPGGTYFCWGPDIAGRTQCRDAACSSASPFFPLSKNQCYGQNNFCYYDQVLSTTNLCSSCSQVSDCFDYQSKDACVTNSCLGDKSCSWVNSQLSGTGWCVEKNYNQTDHCQDCSQTGGIGKNNFCSQAICSSLGSCYSKSNTVLTQTYQWCNSCDDKSRCADLTTQAACEGGQIRQFSSIPGQIIPSGDSCNLGTCRWDSNSQTCSKDGDLDGKSECSSSSSKVSCQQDNLAPVTTPIPSDYIGIGGTQGQVTFQGADANGVKSVDYCIDTTDTCIPNVNLNYNVGNWVTENLANSSALNQAYLQGRSQYYLRFRSIDNYFNLENVKTKGIFVDLTGPKIVLSYTKTEKTSNGQGASDLEFDIVTTEKVSCVDKLVPVGESAINGISSSQIQSVWKVNYANLPDGLYNYFITCTDNFGNSDSANITGIIVDAVKMIRVIRPLGATNQNSFNFQVETQTIGNCQLYDGKTLKENMANDSGTPQTHTSQTYQFTQDGYYQTWRVDCYLPKKDTAWIPFTIDHQPPITSVELTAKGVSVTRSGDFSTSLNDQVSVVFECDDQPQPGFGCKETKWCLTNMTGTCTPNSAANVPELQSSKKLCYYSIDTDNNTEQTHCGKIEVKPGAGVEVIKPSYGVSASTNFNLTIRTNLPTNLCKFGFLSSLNFSTILSTNNLFTKVNTFEHTIPQFTQLLQSMSSTSFPSKDTPLLPLYVVCNLTNGQITAVEPITLYYDPTTPIINVRVEPGSPITSPPAAIAVSSDDAVICKYSTTANDYNSMQGKFPDYGMPVFGTQNRQPLAIVNNGQYTYKVACENKAGLISAVQTVSYTVDFSASGSITGTIPNGSVGNSSVLMEVWTNKDGVCTYAQNGVSSNLVGSQLYHSATLTNLAEGIYKIPVTCQFAASGKSSSGAVNFKVDMTPPTMNRVNDGFYSCGLDKMSVIFEASDNLSSVTEFEYQLIESETGVSLVNGTTTAASLTVSGLNLNESQEYYFKARPKDAAGNWGSYLDGDGFEATLPDKIECLDQGPPVLQFIQNTTAEGTTVTVICNDETGCAGISYGTAATESGCNATQNYQDIPILLTSTSYVCASATDLIGNVGNKTQRIYTGDEDGDGVMNADDQCPGTLPGAVVDTQGCSNKQRSVDTDHDRLPDWWEIRYGSLECDLNYQEEDSNNDGINDDLEDYNQDGVINYDEYMANDDPCAMTDSDDDNIQDALDNCDNTPVNEIDLIITDENSTAYGCGPSERYSLGDGIDDGWRLNYFACIDCPEAAAQADPDKDDLTNLEEYGLKDLYARSTDPTLKDTDGDGYNDGKEVDKGWNPLDPGSPEKSSVLPWIFLILGLVLLVGGVVYLVLLKFVKKSRVPSRSLSQLVRPVKPRVQPGVPVRPVYRSRPVETSYDRLIARRKAELASRRKERISRIFGVFGGKKKVEPLPNLTKIMTRKSKPVFDRLTEATHHYLKRRGEIGPKLSHQEKDIFEELARKIKKPTKTAVKQHFKKKSKKQMHDTFNKLLDIVSEHSGNSFERLKKYAKKK